MVIQMTDIGKWFCKGDDNLPSLQDLITGVPILIYGAIFLFDVVATRKRSSGIKKAV